MTEPGTRQPIITGPRLLVLHGKDDDRYYLVRDEAELNRTALHVMRQRNGIGWYPEPTLEDYIGADTVEEMRRYEAEAQQIPTWPQWLQDQEREKYENVKRYADRQEMNLRLRLRSWRKLQDLLAQPEPEALARTNRYGTPLAWVVFQNLSGDQYGRFDLELFETVEG